MGNERRKHELEKKPDVIPATEWGEELVECPECEGSEGGFDDAGEWHDCSWCNGEGGYWRPVNNTRDGQ